MGGNGGGRYWPDQRRLARLEEAARAGLKAASTAKRNVFLSFVEENLDLINLLRGQARNENSALEFFDHSLKEPYDSENVEYIKRGIRERIRQCSVTVVLLSEQTADSAWVDWEIRESYRQGKGVIAVHAGTDPPARLPRAITELGVRVMRWQTTQVTAAIEEAARERA